MTTKRAPKTAEHSRSASPPENDDPRVAKLLASLRADPTLAPIVDAFEKAKGLPGRKFRSKGSWAPGTRRSFAAGSESSGSGTVVRSGLLNSDCARAGLTPTRSQIPPRSEAIRLELNVPLGVARVERDAVGVDGRRRYLLMVAESRDDRHYRVRPRARMVKGRGVRRGATAKAGAAVIGRPVPCPPHWLARCSRCCSRRGGCSLRPAQRGPLFQSERKRGAEPRRSVLLPPEPPPS